MVLLRGKTEQWIEHRSIHPSNCEDLAAELDSSEMDRRRHAARSVPSCPGAVDLLLARLPQESEASVRAAILNSLVRIGDPAVATGLAELFRSEDVALRNEAIEALHTLAASGDKSNAIPQLLSAVLLDPNPDVRIFALNVADSVRHPDVERWLIEVIDRDEHLNVCATALDLLCEIGTQAATGALLRVKARFASEAYIQFTADLALKRLHGDCPG